MNALLNKVADFLEDLGIDVSEHTDIADVGGSSNWSFYLRDYDYLELYGIINKHPYWNKSVAYFGMARTVIREKIRVGTDDVYLSITFLPTNDSIQVRVDELGIFLYTDSGEVFVVPREVAAMVRQADLEDSEEEAAAEDFASSDDIEAEEVF